MRTNPWVLLAAVSLIGSALAGPVEDANDAYRRGDYQTALRLAEPLADGGDRAAQYRLGVMYERGKGVTQDYAEAEKWYRRSADQGYAQAENNLGYLYEIGKGVPQDYAEAMKWYRKSADQGYGLAQANVGNMYLNGRGVANDDVEAVQWYRKGAEQGNAAAQFNLGFMYERGRGVAKDEAEAVLWYRKGAEQENTAAQFNLGFMYERGRGVAKDEAEAAGWYRRAAEQGFARAQTNLGVMYRDGRGVSRDQALALQWFRKAAGQGDARAQTILSSIERHDRDVSELKSTIGALVKKHEASQLVTSVPDAERTALVREITEATRAREILSYLPEAFGDTNGVPKGDSKISPKLLEAFNVAAVASFRTDRLLSSLERRLAEMLDAATLRVGLQWERSELGRRISSLDLEAAKPAHNAEKRAFAAQFISKGGTADDTRGRACSQKVVLDNSADAMLALLQAVVAGVAMADSAQKGQLLDTDGIARAVVALRPLLRDTAHQAMLTACLYNYRELSDAEFDQWLEFLRTDSGGRYARGSNAAARDTLLEISEVFTRTMIDVARQLKPDGQT